MDGCGDCVELNFTFPLLYPGASLSWNVCVPRMLPTQKATRVSALAVTFLEWPAMLDAFQARRSMNAAPNVLDAWRESVFSHLHSRSRQRGEMLDECWQLSFVLFSSWLVTFLLCDGRWRTN